MKRNERNIAQVYKDYIISTIVDKDVPSTQYAKSIKTI